MNTHVRVKITPSVCMCTHMFRGKISHALLKHHAGLPAQCVTLCPAAREGPQAAVWASRPYPASLAAHRLFQGKKQGSCRSILAFRLGRVTGRKPFRTTPNTFQHCFA